MVAPVVMLDLSRAPRSPELIVIQDVRAIDPAAGLDATVDIVIEDRRLTRVGAGAATAEMKASERALVLDGRGLWALPAFVDLHVHFREPGYEYKEDIASGLRAAAAGGYAHVCAMPNTQPVNDTRGITEMMVARAKAVGGTRLHPIGAITKGLRGEELTEMADLKDAGAVGVSDSSHCVTNSAVMRRAFEYAKTFDLTVIQHCEDHALTVGSQMHEGAVSTRLGLRGSPRAAEDIIVARDILLAESVGARYHVAHISTEGAVRLVREAKERGLPVTAEVTPHHLMLTDEAIETTSPLGYNPICKANPPLREQRDVDACRAGLADGTIDAIASDHAPHSSLEKECEFQAASPGLIGLELVIPVLLDLVRDERVSLDRFVSALTSAPAAVGGLESPSLRVGSIADICLVAPDLTFELTAEFIRSKSTNTPFLGGTYRGLVAATLLQGQLAHVHELARSEPKS